MGSRSCCRLSSGSSCSVGQSYNIPFWRSRTWDNADILFAFEAGCGTLDQLGRQVGFIQINTLVCRSKGDAACIFKKTFFLSIHHYLIYLLTYSQDLTQVRHATLPHLSISLTYFMGNDFNRFLLGKLF